MACELLIGADTDKIQFAKIVVQCCNQFGGSILGPVQVRLKLVHNTARALHAKKVLGHGQTTMHFPFEAHVSEGANWHTQATLKSKVMHENKPM